MRISRTGGLIAVAAAAAAAVAAVAWLAYDVPPALGASARGERARRMRESPNFRAGTFHNRASTRTMVPGSAGSILRQALLGGEQRTPIAPIPLAVPTVGGSRPNADGLSITWYGHASALVELEGARVLFDPVWSDRCSPSRLVGPKRLHRPPVDIEQLPRLDAIVISHDHYDHLDMATVRELVRTQQAPFLVPLGIGAHLERWRVPADRIVELDWSEHVEIAGVRLTCTAAQHFSGRALRRDGTLWASWVVAGAKRRVFYTGDSGYFDGYAAIGEQYGPFDATLVQIGAYGSTWPMIHMTPEEAVEAHLDLRGELMVPVHWCTFNLAFHQWGEPADRLWREAKARDVTLAVPKPGQTIDVDNPPTVDGWWQGLS